MKRKLSFLILLLALVFAGLFVNLNAEEIECIVLYPPGMEPTSPPGYGDPEILESFQPTTVRHILVAAHVVRYSNGTGGISANDINTAIAQLNVAYTEAMVEFELDQTDYIDNDTYAVLTQGEWGSLASINVIPRRLNIYFVPQASGFSGIAYLQDRRCAVTNAAAINGSTLPHEVGHNLFLYHTHGHPGHAQELVNGSNCTTAGDKLCDTPAEPYNDNNGISGWVYTNTCEYFGTFVDPNGDPFSPNTSNFLGYAPPNCRDSFTSQQIQKMNQTLSTTLYDLISIPVTATNKIGTNNAGGTLTINGQTIVSGNSIELEVGSIYPGQTDYERLQGDNKHKDWDEEPDQFHLLEDFTVRRDHPYRDANFVGLSPVSVTTQFISAGGAAGDIEFKDPWYLADGSGSQPNQFFPYSAPFFPTGAYNQSTGGVFLNQEIAANKPYYTVRAPQQQIIPFHGHDIEWYFQKWSGTDVQFQHSDQAETAVVFEQPNAEAIAMYKAHLASSTADAIGGNGGRNVWAHGDDRVKYRLVYEDNGEIYMTSYIKYVFDEEWYWSKEVQLSDGSGTNHSPCISAIDWDDVGVVWQHFNNTTGLYEVVFWEYYNPLQVIAQSSHNNLQPVIGVNSNFNWMFVWNNGDGLKYYDTYMEIIVSL